LPLEKKALLFFTNQRLSSTTKRLAFSKTGFFKKGWGFFKKGWGFFKKGWAFFKSPNSQKLKKHLVFFCNSKKLKFFAVN
jgi:hypothetical protein